MGLIAVFIAVPAGAEAAQPPPFSPYPTFTTTDDATDEAAQALAEILAAAPGENTGIRITGRNEVLVTVPPGVDKGARASSLRTALSARRADGVRVTVSTVPRSRSELQRVKDALTPLLGDPRYKGRIVGVGEDPSLGVAVVYATADSDAARTEIAAKYGDAVVFRLDGTPQVDDADRDRDSSPHYGGAGYLNWNSAHTSYFTAADPDWCSTAFPVIHGGATYMHTAGHCLPGNPQYPSLWASYNRSATVPSSAFSFGSLFTTTISGTESNPTSGTQGNLGDWTMIRGSTYYPRVYSCANTTGSCTTLGVGAVSWVAPVMGAGACSSGRTTAQTCRYRVTDPDTSVNFGGWTTGKLAVLRSNQDQTGGDDCGGWASGDSGGAIYQAISGRAGYVRAMGIVTGHSSASPCNYYYTKLQGVKTWSPNASMPLL
jgi:hypothetical protein